MNSGILFTDVSHFFFAQLLEADEGSLWWRLQCGNQIGFAAKYYFVHKDNTVDYKKEPWYFGEMSREEAEHLLGDNANSEGKFDLC